METMTLSAADVAGGWFQSALEDLGVVDASMPSSSSSTNNNKTMLSSSDGMLIKNGANKQRITVESKVDWTRRKIKILDDEDAPEELLKEAKEQQQQQARMIERQGSHETTPMLVKKSPLRPSTSRKQQQQQRDGPTTVAMLLGNHRSKEDAIVAPTVAKKNTEGRVIDTRQPESVKETSSENKQRKHSTPLFGLGRKTADKGRLPSSAATLQRGDTPPPPPPPPPSPFKKKRSKGTESSAATLFRRKQQPSVPSPRRRRSSSITNNTDGGASSKKASSSSGDHPPPQQQQVSMVPLAMPSPKTMLGRKSATSTNKTMDAMEDKVLAQATTTKKPTRSGSPVSSDESGDDVKSDAPVLRRSAESVVSGASTDPMLDLKEAGSFMFGSTFFAAPSESSEQAEAAPSVAVESSAGASIFDSSVVGSTKSTATTQDDDDDKKKEQDAASTSIWSFGAVSSTASKQLQDASSIWSFGGALNSKKEDETKKEVKLEAFVDSVTKEDVVAEAAEPVGDGNNSNKSSSMLRSRDDPSLSGRKKEKRVVRFSPSTTSKRKGRPTRMSKKKSGSSKSSSASSSGLERKMKGSPSRRRGTNRRMSSRSPVKMRGGGQQYARQQAQRRSKDDLSLMKKKKKVPDVGYSTDPANNARQGNFLKRYFAKMKLQQEDPASSRSSSTSLQEEDDDVRRALEIWKSRGALTEDDDLNERVVQDNAVLLSTMLMLEKYDLAAVEMEYAPFLHNHDGKKADAKSRVTTDVTTPSRAEKRRQEKAKMNAMRSQSPSPRSVARKQTPADESQISSPTSKSSKSAAKKSKEKMTEETLGAIPLTTRTGSTTECILKTEDDLSTASSRRKEKRAKFLETVIRSSSSSRALLPSRGKHEDPTSPFNTFWL